MTHPSRLAAAESLGLQLTADGIATEIVLDPDPTGPPNALRTSRLAFAQAGDRGFHVVVQDDVELCPSFAVSVERHIELQQGRGEGATVLSLFSEWSSRTGQAVRGAALMGSPLAPIVDGVVPAQAVLVDAATAHAFSTYAVAPLESGMTRDGRLLWEFCESQGIRPMVTAPNLVDHDTRLDHSLWPLSVLKRGPRRSAFFTREGEPKISISRAETAQAVLERTDVCYLSSRSLTAEVSSRATLSAEFDLTSALSAIGLRSGMSIESVARKFREHESAFKKLYPTLGAPFLFQVFLCCFGVGLLNPNVVSDEGTTVPLTTLVPGSLRQVMDVDALYPPSPETATTLVQAVAAGAEVASSG